MKKRTLTILKVTAVLVLVLAVVYGLLSFLATRKLDEAYAALKADSRPLQVRDVIPKEVPASENAAPLYQAAVLTLQSESSKKSDLFQHLADLGQKVIDSTASADEVAHYKTRVGTRAVQEALQVVGRAAKRDRCWYDVDYSKGPAVALPHLGNLRNLSRIVCATAIVEAEAGDVEQAWSRALTAVRLADALRDEPYLISQLVRISQIDVAVSTVQRLCAITIPTQPTIEKLRKALQRFESVEPLVRAMDGERLLFGDWMFRQAESGLTEEELASWGIPVWFFWLGPAVTADHAEYLDIMRQYATYASQPYAQSDDTFGDQMLAQVPFYGIQTRLMAPALSRVKSETLKMIARARITQAGLSVLGVSRKDGPFPKTLGEVSIDVPIDPFTGEPLVYRSEGQGFVITSTGPDPSDHRGGAASESDDDREKEIAWRFPGTGS